MELFLYGALVLSILGTTGKQFAMKHCGGRAPGLFNSICINAMRAVICLAVSLIIWLVKDGAATNTLGYLCIVAGGVGTAINLLTWILSSRLVSLIFLEAVITVTTMVIPMLLSPVLYNGESASPLQWLGCGMILFSILCFSSPSREEKKGSLPAKIAAVGICAASAGLAAIAKKYFSYYVESKGQGSNEYYTMMSFVVILIVFAVMFLFFAAKERKEKGRVSLPYARVWPFILLAAVMLYVNELFSTYASALPSAIYYPALRGLATVSTFLLDVIAFKDKVTLRKLIGLLLITVAVVVINL